MNFSRVDWSLLSNYLSFPIKIGKLDLTHSDVESVKIGSKLSTNMLIYSINSMIDKHMKKTSSMKCAYLPPTDFDDWPKNRVVLLHELKESLDFKNQSLWDSIKTKLFFPINHFDNLIVVAFITDNSEVITEIYVPSISSCQDKISLR